MEIGLLDAFGKDENRAAVEVVRSAPPGTWTNVGDWARIRRVDEGQSLPPLFDADGAQIVVGGEATTQGPSAGSVIRWEESDKRAEAALKKSARSSPMVLRTFSS